jgi:prevent-host-death family protein
MLIEATAMKVRQNFGELLNQVQYRNAAIEITKSSKPVAAIIGIELFDKIQSMKKEFDRLNASLQSTFKASESKEINAEIDEAIKNFRVNKREKSSKK